MKLRDLVGIVATRGCVGIEVYDERDVRQERGMLLYSCTWDNKEEFPSALLDRDVAMIYGDLDYTWCYDDISDVPGAVTVIELRGGISDD